eukprot:930438-Pyramimonas_sp.AAC.1
MAHLDGVVELPRSLSAMSACHARLTLSSTAVGCPLLDGKNLLSHLVFGHCSQSGALPPRA